MSPPRAMSGGRDIAFLDGASLRAALPFRRLIPALRQAFSSGAIVPPRHHHSISLPNGNPATLLLMPAWQEGGYLGVKIVSVHPDNADRNLPALHSVYLLSDGTTGIPLALLDGNEITGRRTAAVAALGADLLARDDATRLAVIGSGRIAALLPEAFAAVRDIRSVAVWSRNRDRSEALVADLRDRGHDAHVASDVESAVGQADIVSCATLATAPLVAGRWLRPGTHLDLIGSFTPQMREADDAAIVMGRLYVDTDHALSEAGELVQPLSTGAIGVDHVVGTLEDLCAGRVSGRSDPGEITVFTAVATDLSDITASALAYRTLNASGS